MPRKIITKNKIKKAVKSTSNTKMKIVDVKVKVKKSAKKTTAKVKKAKVLASPKKIINSKKATLTKKQTNKRITKSKKRTKILTSKIKLKNVKKVSKKNVRNRKNVKKTKQVDLLLFKEGDDVLNLKIRQENNVIDKTSADFILVENNKSVHKKNELKNNLKNLENSKNNNKKDAIDNIVYNDLNIDNTNQNPKIKIDNYIKQSPHLIDLKKNILTNDKNVNVSDSKEYIWEEKFADFDDKFEKAKANFINEEAIKRAQLFSKYTPGKFKRKIYLFFTEVSLVLEKIVKKSSTWTEKRLNTFLVNKTNLQSEDIKKEQIPKELNPKELSYQKGQKSKSKHFNFDYLFFLQKKDIVVSLSLFLIMAITITLPLKAMSFYYGVKENKAKVLGASTTVFKDMTNGLNSFKNFKFDSAGNDFSSANKSFNDIKDVLNEYPSFLISLSGKLPKIGKEVTAGQALINTGNYLSQIGLEISNMLNIILTDDKSTLTDKMISLENSLRRVNGLLSAANNNLNSIDIKYVPDEYQDKIKWLKDWLPRVEKVITRGITMSDFGAKFLGHDRPQKYLVVFQNSNELRPTGGFLGTVAEINLDQGKIKNLYIPPGGSYDMQGNLKVLLESPKPLHLLNANWQLQDANWFFDFPTSAEKILWFYEKSGGPTMDGVIAINSTILPKLLKLTGPIYLPEFNITLNDASVIDTLQQEVELNYDKKKNQPKKIIASLVPLLIEKLQTIEADKFWEVFETFDNFLINRNIQIYHRNEKMEDKIKKLDWSGSVKKSDIDYLAVVDTNIGGGKTDGFINQSYDLQTTINDKGEIINNLTITREHLGFDNDYFSGKENIDYLRIYVPLGSKLIKVNGFWHPNSDEFSSPEKGYKIDNFLLNQEKNPIIDESSGTRITEEFGKTVFANWVRVKPGEKKKITFTYILPNKLKFNNSSVNSMITKYFDKFFKFIGFKLNNWQKVTVYTMKWQKQSGQMPPNITHKINLPDNWQVLTTPSLNNKMGKQENSIYYENVLNKDNFWGVILNK